MMGRTWQGLLPGLAGTMLLPVFTSAQPANGEALGRLDAFWRNRPVIGRWLSSELGLQRIPSYLRDDSLSFPYRERAPGEREVPFADHLTVVRLLGGWLHQPGRGEYEEHRGEADLAYRDDEGRIRYRWELLPPRLDHYVERGYDLTLVLDNTPWCFPEEPAHDKTYGQHAPPKDFEEWEAFIEELCRELVRLYGYERVSRWRFRMGTEAQGTERFSGSQEEFFRLYDHAGAAVKRVVPEAAFGPFNLAGRAHTGNVVFNDLARHAVSGSNLATGQIGSPFDFAPMSVYTVPKVSGGSLRTTNERYKAQQKIDDWNQLEALYPDLAGVSREIHEFGILTNEFGVGSGEPGARGAAWFFNTMMHLREGGVDALWNWGVYDSIRARDGVFDMLTGEGFVYQILEHAAGGELFALTPELRTIELTSSFPNYDSLLVIQEYQRPEPLRRVPDASAKTYAVTKESAAFVFVSLYHEDRFYTKPTKVTITLADELLPGPVDSLSARYTMLARTNSPHWMMRQQLEQEGLLREDFVAVPGLISTSRHMAGDQRAAGELIYENREHYIEQTQDLLTLKPTAVRWRQGSSGPQFDATLVPPSFLVLVLQRADSPDDWKKR